MKLLQCLADRTLTQRVFLSMLVAVVLVALSPSQVLGTNGYIPHGIGTASKGMAGAGTALPQDTLSAFSNPAGMFRVGKRVDAELSFFMPNREYKANDDGAPGPLPPSVPAGTFSSENDLFLIPAVGANWVIDDRSTIGFSIVPQGGLNTEYNTSTFERFAPPNTEFSAGEPTGVDLAILATSVTYAREVFPGHAIGLTPIFALQRFKAQGLQPFKAFSVSPNDVTNNGNEYSYGGGFRIGWLGRLHEQLDVGISYQSRLWMTDFDDYSGLFADTGDFDIPPILDVGLAFKLTPEITLLADYQRIFYGDIDAVNNDNDPSFPLSQDRLLGASNGLGFGWDDIDIWKVGVQWDVHPKLTLRAGYSNGETPWDGPNTLFNVDRKSVV